MIDEGCNVVDEVEEKVNEDELVYDNDIDDDEELELEEEQQHEPSPVRTIAQQNLELLGQIFSTNGVSVRCGRMTTDLGPAERRMIQTAGGGGGAGSLGCSTYGELAMDGLPKLLRRAPTAFGPSVRFVDLGSGSGRLVLQVRVEPALRRACAESMRRTVAREPAGAPRHRPRLVPCPQVALATGVRAAVGVELSPSRHALACAAMEQAMGDDRAASALLRGGGTGRVAFVLGDMLADEVLARSRSLRESLRVFGGRWKSLGVFGSREGGSECVRERERARARVEVVTPSRAWNYRTRMRARAGRWRRCCQC